MSTKYDKTMLLQLAQQPKSKGGRPRKFATPEEKRAADVEYHRIARLRAKCIAEGKELPDELKLKRIRKYASEEERRQAVKTRTNEYFQTHKEARHLCLAVSHVRKTLI